MSGWWEGNASARRAASNVIGVVLLVGLVVLLAGATSYFLFGFGGESRTPPPQFATEQAYNDTDRARAADGEYLNVTHHSGDVVNARNVTLSVNDAVVRDSSGARVDDAELTAPDALAAQVGDSFGAQETLVISASLFEKRSGGPIGPGEHLDLSQAVIRLIWEPPHEGRTEVVFKWVGPDDR